MSDFFRIIRGLEIDEAVRILQGSGAPGYSEDTNDSPIGSIYTNNITGALYTKVATGTGPSKWQAAGSGSGGSTSLALLS